MSDITVFISYAREDEAQATGLRSHLVGQGFGVWMDRFDILPGECWDTAIQRGLGQAHFVVTCLSRRSVAKRGYLQREFRKALDLATEMLDDDIYLIPVRFDDCDVPDRLARFQFVDLYGPEGTARLLTALRTGAERRGLLTPPAPEPPSECVAADLSELGSNKLLDFVSGRLWKKS